MDRQKIINIANSIPGTQTRIDYIECLIDMANRLPENCRILEIGACAGGSAITMALTVKERNGIVFTIDPGFREVIYWPEEYKKIGPVANLHQVIYNAFIHGVSGHVIPLPGTSKDILNQWDGSRLFDLIYIDGEHSYEAVKIDMQWAKHTTQKAYIMLDDWIDVVEKACIEYIVENPQWIRKHDAVLPYFQKT